jgi:hypothetical protein
MEVLEIIDLTMDDDEEPIPNTSYYKDEAPVGQKPNNALPFNVGRDITTQGPKYYRLSTRALKSRIRKEVSPEGNSRDDQQETLLVALIDDNVKLARRP